MSFAPSNTAHIGAGEIRHQLDAVPRALTVAAVVLIFTLSPAALDVFGLDYLATGGNPLTKIHPGTIAAMLAVLAWIVVLGPMRFIARILAFPGLPILGAAVLFLILYDVASVREPVTPLIETFGLPLALSAAVLLDPTAPRLWLQRLIHGVFALNAVIGISEFLSGRRLFPFRFANGLPVPEDWRSTALFGHPLTNAMLITTYVVALLVGARGLSPRVRVGMILLQAGALVVFGGRTGLVLSGIAIFCAVAAAGGRFLLGARVRVLDIVAVVAMVPIFAIGLDILVERGFFDLLLQRFVSDDGSAQTRVIMLRVLGELSTNDFLFGTPPGSIATLVTLEGLEYGIESFEVAMIIMFGLLPCLIFFAALAAFVIDIVRATRPAALLPLGCFFLLASTSLSIAAKAPELGMAIATVLITMRIPPAARQDEAPC